uniref:XCL1 ancestor n=1 Tax=synthetic construct TaxID=32630 RepID=UPI0018EA31D7|nr:Chain A, XCL1 ancestor [unidentified]
ARKSCCLKYTKRPLPLKRIKSYTIQSNEACNIKAIIFTTKKGRKICANPNEKWVQKAMKHLDKK